VFNSAGIVSKESWEKGGAMFKKGILALSIVALVVFAAGLAFAADIDGLTDLGDMGGYNVYVNPGNQGDTLLYGYYNVRGYGNLFTIVNTSDTSGVVARIRFREATQSDEVLDFNICLSKDDMFVGVIVDDGTQGRLFQLDSDTTLTAPSIPSTGVAFKHSGNGGNSTVTADETKEGYFELIGLQTIAAEPTTCPSTTSGGDATNDVPNVLAGAFFMQNLSTGDLYSYRALALADFSLCGIDTPLGLGTLFPELDDGLDSACVTVGINPVNWALTKRFMSAEYFLNTSGDTNLDDSTGEAAYVLTFPTKSLSLSKWEDSTSCTDTLGAQIGFEIFDENENTITTPEQFSPVKKVVNVLCYEVNVIELGNDTVTSDILNSGVEIGVSTDTFGIGWIRLDLYNGIAAAHATINSQSTVNSLGLPSWGWWLQRVGTNGTGTDIFYETDYYAG
jgi:hypothetical protein